MRRLLGILLASVLAGCGSAAEVPQPEGPVKLLVFGSPDELEAYRTLVKSYKGGSYKGGDVQLIEAGDRTDLITRLSTSIAGGAPPDLFLMNYRFYGQFASKNAIEGLDGRLSASEVIKEWDFFPSAMEAFKWRGRQLCMPQNVASLVVYYNVDMFHKYGIAEPKLGWTWNDMITAATALTRDATGTVVKGTETEGAASKVAVYGLGTESSIVRLAPFVWSNSAEIVDNQDKPTKLTLDTPAAREALKNLVDLRLAYGVVPTDQEVEAENDDARFANGRLAMLFQSRRATPTFRKIKDFTWDVAPLPIYDKPANVLHSDAFCMTRGSKNKEAAWRFMEYAMSEPGQGIFAGTGRIVPSNTKVARSPAFLDPTKAPKSAQVFLDNINPMRQLPTVSTWPEIEDITSGILENAMYRGDKLDDVIAEIDKQTRPVFARGEGP